MAFYEFNAAVSGLHTIKTALATTSNNVANASTKGYSRLVTDIKATPPLKSLNGVGMVGTGSTVSKVYQMREFYLDKKFWAQESKNGEYSMKNQQLDIIETMMNELADVALTGDLNSFFNTLSEAATFANDDSYRTSVITYAQNLAIDVNLIGESLLKLQSQINDEVHAIVTKINAIGKQISTLTKEIYSYEMGSLKEASSMRDQRNLLIDELSQYINIEVKEKDGPTDNPYDKKFYLLISGQEYVNHYDFIPLECAPRQESLNREDYPYLYDVFFANNEPLNVDGLSGELGALLQIRDGNTEITDIIYSENYIDTPKFQLSELQDSVILQTGSYNSGKYKYEFHMTNADSIELKGYGMDDKPGGLSAHDNNGNIIYESSDPQIEEKTMLTLNLNPNFRDPDGTYNVGLDVDLESKTALITYKYTDENGVEHTETEEIDIPDIRSVTYLKINGNDVNIKAAKAKQQAFAEVYSNYNGIPYYMSKLNNFAATLARAINLGQYADGTQIGTMTGHVNAYDKDGETGNLFFSYKDEEGNIQTGDIDYDKITALNFCISKEISESPRNFAASTTYTLGNTADESNNLAALGYLALKDEETLFKEGGVYNYINAISTKLGIDNRQSYKYSLYYESTSAAVDSQRLSVSSVSINEEMTDLVRYQQTYTAASKVINTINQIYNTLVNGTF